MSEGLPTARTTLRAEYVCLLVWCTSCHHQAPADLRALVDAGRGDVPLRDLRFRCTGCGSSEFTDSVVSAKNTRPRRPGGIRLDLLKRAASTVGGVWRMLPRRKKALAFGESQGLVEHDVKRG